MHTRREHFAVLAGAFVSKPRRPPNIVVVVIDDLGARDLGCYGSEYYETPRIDALASEGVCFTQAYAASPVCSPTRASILTGMHPARLGITNFLPGDHRLPHSKLLPPQSAQFLPRGCLTIAQILKQSGYQTGLVGKWHLGGAPHSPKASGFDFSVGGNEAGRPNDYFFPGWRSNINIAGEPGEYLTDRLTKESIRFLNSSRGQPFFLYLAHYGVHNPLIGKPSLVEYFERRARSANAQGSPQYAAMIKSVDESVGALSDYLKSSGLDRDTVFIVVSDNGGTSVPEWQCTTATSNAPLREGKGHLYEGGIRVPLIVRWPGRIAPRTRIDQPVSTTDFLPSLAQIAGCGTGHARPDGVSFVPLFEGAAGEPRNLYWHYPHYSVQGGRPSAAIRESRWKLLEFFEEGGIELYDLETDVSERNDLQSRFPDRAADLHQKLKHWRSVLKAPMPLANPEYDAAREWDGLAWKQRCISA